MQRRFNSKVVLVTGGTSGLGLNAALAFAKEGASVVVAGRREKEGQEAVGNIKAAGGEALFVRADVSKESDVIALIKACVDAYGRLDCAYNNAGIDGTLMTPLASYDTTVWEQVMAINLTGTFLCMKHEIPEMLKRSGGSIVNMASVSGAKAAKPIGAAYVASKHAVIGLTRQGALEYASQGIRVNAVCPGAIRTGMTSKLLQDEETARMVTSLHPVGRIGEPREVSALVLWLSSGEAGFVTGAAVPVDGGYLL